MNAKKACQLAPWVCFLLLVTAFPFAQNGYGQQPARQSIGRYVIYYHPSNFNQAFLLDTTTGTAWRLVYGSYKSTVEGKEDEVQYPVFERLGVEGLYKSAAEEIAEQQMRNEIMEKLQKQAEEERKEALEQLEEQRRRKRELQEVERRRLREQLEEQRKKEEKQRREQFELLKKIESNEERLERLGRAALPSEEQLRNIASRSNGTTVGFLNILNRDWPGYPRFTDEFTHDELFYEIRNRYPKLAEDFPSIFAEAVKIFKLPE